MTIFRLAILTAAIITSQAVVARAATCTWTGAGPNANWSAAANWTNCSGGVPSSGDSLIFPNGAARADNTNDLIGRVIRSISITGGVGGTSYQLNGRPVFLNGPLDVSASSGPFSARIALPLVLGSEVVITSQNGGQVTVDSVDLAGHGLAVNAARAIYVGRITGSGSILKQGVSILTLGGGSTFTGGVSIFEGGLVVSRPDSLGATGPDNGTSVRPGAFVELLNGITVSEQFGLEGSGAAGTGALRVNGQDNRATVTGPITLIGNAAFGANDGGALVIAGDIRPLMPPERPHVIKVGSGTVTLSSQFSANWGLLDITAGTLALGAINVLPDTAPVVISGNGVLDLAGHDEAIGPLASPTLGSTDSPRVLLSGAALTINQTQDFNYYGMIQGNGRVTKTGGGQLAFLGPLTTNYSGPTTVQAGRLLLAKSNGAQALNGPVVISGGVLTSIGPNQINDGSAVTIDSPGMWELHSVEQIASLAGSGTLRFVQQTNVSNRLIIGGGASTTFAGSMNGLAQTELVKAGTGTLTLTGASAFTGSVRVTAGTLAVHGRLAADTAIRVDGGTLAGNGEMGDVSGSSGVATGTISPGASPGVLGATTLVLGSALEIELNGDTPGSGYDQLRVVGGLSLRAGAKLRVTRGFAPKKNTQFTIVDAGQPTAGTFEGLANGAELSIDGQRFRIDYAAGADGKDIVLTALEDGSDAGLTYYLAEGATGGFFDEDVLLANPSNVAAPVTLTFFKDTGEQVVASRIVGPMSQQVVHVDEIPGLETATASVKVVSTAGLELFVERTMFWDARSYAGHTGSALSQPSSDWYFAEGAQGFFDTFILVVNPGTTPADVTFRFLLETGEPFAKTLSVGAGSRLTLNAGDYPELATRTFGIQVHATQPIMAERAMYFGSATGRLWSGGHESAGVTALATRWFLAEGATSNYFDTFILLSNPQPTRAYVTLTFLLDTGETISVPKIVQENGRLTVNPKTEGDPRLWQATFSTVVESDRPIVTERSMYWLGARKPWGESHNSFGVVEPSTSWGLAEGRLGGTRAWFNTYILLANPQTTAAEVDVLFLRDAGAPFTRRYTVPARSRYTISAGTVEELENSTFGARIDVANGVPIVVERSMYWSADGVFWTGGTNATGIRRTP